MKKRIGRILELTIIVVALITASTTTYADYEPEIFMMEEPTIIETALPEVAKGEKEPITIEDKISKACADYGISDEIPLAIAKLETGHFTSNAYINHNNPGGMSINEVPITYNTLDEGVEAFVSNLAENYFGIGLTTPEAIAQKYCPVNAENWASLVNQLM